MRRARIFRAPGGVTLVRAAKILDSYQVEEGVDTDEKINFKKASLKCERSLLFLMKYHS